MGRLCFPGLPTVLILMMEILKYFMTTQPTHLLIASLLNDKGNGKSYVRRNDRGLKISCHSRHLCHIQSRGKNATINLLKSAVTSL